MKGFKGKKGKRGNNVIRISETKEKNVGINHIR